MLTLAANTLVPIFLLMVAGLLSRRFGLLKAGDERVLSSYIYFFAMPALSLTNLAEIHYTQETLRFILAGILPVLVVVAFYVLLSVLFRMSKDTLYLLIVSTVFGSVAFFGIPFITFAIPTPEAEHLSVLAVASISPLSVGMCITVLELRKLKSTSLWKGCLEVLRNFSRNPLILSILLGSLIGLLGWEIPEPLSASLKMLGKTTSAVAIFMLGVFLYGRKYANMGRGFQLSLLRVVLFPLLALGASHALALPNLERTVLVLMHSTPIAVSVIVLSERYDFFKETIASLTLVSSLGGGLYSFLWLNIVG